MVTGRTLQRLDSPHPATYVGKGKLDEVHQALHRTGAEAVIFFGITTLPEPVTNLVIRKAVNKIAAETNTHAKRDKKLSFVRTVSGSVVSNDWLVAGDAL